MPPKGKKARAGPRAAGQPGDQEQELEQEVKLPCELYATNAAKVRGGQALWPFQFDKKRWLDYFMADREQHAVLTAKIAPKVVQICENIASLPGKHVVFSNDNDFLAVLAGYMACKAWLHVVWPSFRDGGNWYEDVGSDPDLDYDPNGRNVARIAPYRNAALRPTFLVLPGGAMYGGSKGGADYFKNELLGAYNDPQNAGGQNIKVILLSSKFREGITLKDVASMHIAEPFVTDTQQTQALGRALRNCSHQNIPWNPRTPGWTVDIYTYHLTSQGRHLFQVLQDKITLGSEIRSNAVDLTLTAPISADPLTYDKSDVPLSSGAVRSFPLAHLLIAALATGLPIPPARQWQPCGRRCVEPLKDALVSMISDTSKTKSAAGARAAARVSLAQMKGVKPPRVAGEPRAAYDKRVSDATGPRRLRHFLTIHLSKIARNKIRWEEVLPPWIAREVDNTINSASGTSFGTAGAIPAQPFATRKEMQAFMHANWMHYAWDSPMNDGSACAIEPEANATQRFLPEWFVPPSPWTGMLAFHSVGAGKTLLGMLMCQKWKTFGKRTTWVTRTTLTANAKKEQETWIERGLVTRSVDAIISFKQLFNTVFGGKFGDQQNVGTVLGKDAVGKPYGAERLKNHLLVIDEVHLLFEPGSLSAQEDATPDVVERLMREVGGGTGNNRCRLLAMTATPDGSRNTWECIKQFCGNHEFGNVSYLNMAKDKTRFAQPVFKPVAVDVPPDHPVIAHLNWQCNGGPEPVDPTAPPKVKRSAKKSAVVNEAGSTPAQKRARAADVSEKSRSRQIARNASMSIADGPIVSGCKKPCPVGSYCYEPTRRCRKKR